MGLHLYMVGLIVQDMVKSVEFYRRLGLGIPEGSEKLSHVEVKMGENFTFFLDAKPWHWDPAFVKYEGSADQGHPGGHYQSLLEFYLPTSEAVEAKYYELLTYGYQGERAPYATTFAMCFALVKDPDGNTILLSGNLKKE